MAKPDSWQEPLTRAQVWLGVLVALGGIVAVPLTFVMTTREKTIRLEGRIERLEEVQRELKAVKDLKQLGTDMEDLQQALRELERQLPPLRGR